MLNIVNAVSSQLWLPNSTVNYRYFLCNLVTSLLVWQFRILCYPKALQFGSNCNFVGPNNPTWRTRPKMRNFHSERVLRPPRKTVQMFRLYDFPCTATFSDIVPFSNLCNNFKIVIETAGKPGHFSLKLVLCWLNFALGLSETFVIKRRNCLLQLCHLCKI